MTRRTNARVAGIAFLAYIVIGISMMVLLRPTGAPGIAERLTAGQASYPPTIWPRASSRKDCWPCGSS
jgi:hypothetical protein